MAGAAPTGAVVRGLSPAAGFLGGLLGTTTSLIGVPPALLLTRSRPAAASLFADLRGIFIATPAIALVVLAAEGISTSAARTFVWWLPGVLMANAIGVTVGLRPPAPQVRRLTLGVAFAAGVVTPPPPERRIEPDGDLAQWCTDDQADGPGDHDARERRPAPAREKAEPAVVEVEQPL